MSFIKFLCRLTKMYLLLLAVFPPSSKVKYRKNCVPSFPIPQADCQGLQPCNILRDPRWVLNENHWFAAGPGLAES